MYPSYIPFLASFQAALKNSTAAWPPGVAADARALVGALLAKEPSKRPSANEVCGHSWLATHVSPSGELLPEELVHRRRASGGGEEEQEAPRVVGWWCDVGGEGCLRPSASTTERQYDPSHQCWAYEGTYTVMRSLLRLS